MHRPLPCPIQGETTTWLLFYFHSLWEHKQTRRVQKIYAKLQQWFTFSESQGRRESEGPPESSLLAKERQHCAWRRKGGLLCSCCGVKNMILIGKPALWLSPPPCNRTRCKLTRRNLPNVTLILYTHNSVSSRRNRCPFEFLIISACYI